MKRESGQALTEFAVGVTAMLLLAIGTQTIAGFQEVQRRSIVGARQAGFESIWRNGRAATVPPAETAFRTHFDDPGLRRPVSGTPWVRSGDVQLSSLSQSAPGHAATAAGVLLTPLQVASGFLGSDFDLANNGYSTTTLEVRSSASLQPEPFGDLELALAQPLTLLSDAWNASGSPQVSRRTAGLVPTASLAAISGLWRTLAAPLALVEPGLDQLCLGLIEPEMLPEDRLGPVSLPAQAPGNCR